MKRIHIIISGDVQGVGYRVWVVRQANDLELVGWVKNCDDGSVEVVAEGSKDDLEALLKRCRKGPDVAWVEQVEANWHEATGEFVTFGVVY